MTPEQSAWVRANLPGHRRRIPCMAEAVGVFGVPVPPVASFCCNTITVDEAAEMALEQRREALQRAAESARMAREDEWAAYYGGE